MFGGYDAKANGWAAKLRDLIEWFAENHPVELAELYGEPCTHFKPSSHPDANFLQWVWWHPESAQYWIKKLENERGAMDNVDEFNRIMEDIEQGAFDAESPVDETFEADIAKLEDSLAWQAEYEDAQTEAADPLDLYKVVLVGNSGWEAVAYVMAHNPEEAREIAVREGQKELQVKLHWRYVGELSIEAPTLIGLARL